MSPGSVHRVRQRTGPDRAYRIPWVELSSTRPATDVPRYQILLQQWRRSLRAVQSWGGRHTGGRAARISQRREFAPSRRSGRWLDPDRQSEPQEHEQDSWRKTVGDRCPSTAQTFPGAPAAKQPRTALRWSASFRTSKRLNSAAGELQPLPSGVRLPRIACQLQRNVRRRASGGVRPSHGFTLT